MATYSYRSATDFDRDLELDIIESRNDRKTVFFYTGFKSMEQAVEFTDWWTVRTGWGYSPYATAYVNPIDEQVTVKAERSSSCD